MGVFGLILLLIFGIQLAEAHDSHPGNPFKHGEHEALLNIVPISAASTTAIASGAWSNPATWSGGIPAINAKVVIPSGITVTYDRNDTTGATPLRWVRIDGTLRFSTTVTTRMLVDTIAVTPSGTIQIGTDADPVPSTISATVLFTDSGAISRTEDPYLIGRGLISHGSASIVGAFKTAYVPTGSIAAGATTITLESPPTGWVVGDTVLISGSQLPISDWGKSAYQDEVRTIQAISGNTLTLDSALQYGHTLLASPVPLHNYIGNLSRNITFSSTNTNMGVDYRDAHETKNLLPTLQSQNANIQRRGHVMFMHSSDVRVKFAAFNDLGRSNKDLYVDDVPEAPMQIWEDYTDPAGVFHPEGSTIIGTGTNPRGRYSLHFHLCGSKDVNAADGSGPQFSYNDPVICEGVVTRNSPGWAYSNHDSYVKFLDCIAYNSYGSGFVEESGNGIGEFRRCLSVRNGHNNTNDTAGDWREILGLMDVGRSGHGFFYRGNMVETYDCVAVSCDSSAYAWNGKHGAGGSLVPAQNLPYPAITNGEEYIPWELTPYTQFQNNVGIACVDGVHAYYSQPRGDGRSVLENTVLWNINEIGYISNYGNDSGQITVTGMTILADSTAYTDRTIGMSAAVTFNDTVWDNCYIKGFHYGIKTDNGANGVRKITLVNNPNITNNVVQIEDTTRPVVRIAPPVDRNVLSFTPDSGMNYVSSLSRFSLKGTKYDSVGSDRTGEDVYGMVDENRFVFSREVLLGMVQKGYFSDSGGNYLVLPYAITNRVTGAVKTLYHKLYTDLSPDVMQYQNGNVPLGLNLGAFVDPGTIQVPVPILLLPPGNYTTPQKLTLFNPLPGVFYYYTTDGSTPAQAANGRPAGTSILYSGPISLPAGTSNFKLVAHAGIMTPSNVVSATYTSNVNPAAAAPVFSLPGGIYPVAQNVAISSTTSGAAIRYTLDGQEPTSTAGIIYTAPVSVPVNKTLKAIAFGAGYLNSAVSSARYSTAAETMVTYSTGDTFSAGVSGKDLLQTSASLLSSSGNFKNENTFGIPSLTNGSAISLATARAGISSNSTLVYQLDTTKSPSGYIIKMVDIFTGSYDTDRIRPNVTVSYSLVSSPSTFVTIATAAYTPPGNYNSQQWTKSSISSSSGPLASGVEAIKFAFGTQFNGSTQYSELDVMGVPFTNLPQSPSSLTAASSSSTMVHLSWMDNAFNETGFKVYRSPNGYSNWTQIGTPPADAMHYADMAVAPNTVYYYRATATNANGDSDYSEISAATTLASTGPTYTVSGRITQNSAGIAGVTISDGPRNAITASDGTYFIFGVPAGSYTLTPSKAGYTFTPATLSADVSSAALTDRDFAALQAVPVIAAGQSFSGAIGLNSSYQIVASNSPTSYALASGVLPQGITINGSTGILSGTPTTAGTSSFSVTAANNAGTSLAVSITFSTSLTTQTITFGSLPEKTVGNSTFNLTATTSSGLTISFTSGNPAVATISGNTVTIIGPGSSTITASQAGNSSFATATNVTQVFTVNPVSQGLSILNHSFEKASGYNEANNGFPATSSWEDQTANVGNTQVRTTAFTGKHLNNYFSLGIDVGTSGYTADGYLYSGSLGTFAANTVYTLTVAMAVESDNRASFIGLATGSTMPSLVGRFSANSTAMSSTEFGDYAYFLDTAVTPSVVGQNIRIFLGQTTNAASQYGRNTFFDNVRLTSASIPIADPTTGLVDFRSENGLDSGGGDDGLSAAGDGVPNLLKYAFNMIGTGTGQVASLNTPNASVLTASDTAGLPLVGVETATGKLQLTYIRRKAAASPAPGITYAVEFSDVLATWTVNGDVIESVTDLGTMFERVTLTDNVVSPGNRFVRIRVTAP